MKSSEFEKEKRVYRIAELLLDGMTRTRDIFRYVSENEKWDVTTRTLENYLAEAKEFIRSQDYKDLDLQLKKSLQQLDNLIYKNLKIQDYREVRNCIKAKADLLGLVVEKKEVTAKVSEEIIGMIIK